MKTFAEFRKLIREHTKHEHDLSINTISHTETEEVCCEIEGEHSHNNIKVHHKGKSIRASRTPNHVHMKFISVKNLSQNNKLNNRNKNFSKINIKNTREINNLV